ncbi:MAG: methyltransferase domain-containing protein, partial [Nitrospinales bacterium]|nr:methyltransferase domain-containing protein [Nitrospinales bacterium]
MIDVKCISEKTVKCIEINTHQEPLTMHLKILSYNWHEPYLCLLSKIGHTFLIVEPEISKENYRRWDKNMRPIPDNVILVSEKEAISQLDEGAVDLVIAHNIKDLVKIYEYSLPKILVFHNKLSTEIKLGNNKVSREDYLNKINPLLINVKKVFISESKRRDWGMTGDVILPGIDVNDYGGYRGDNPSVLRVGNLIKERDLMMGFTTSESILSGLPSVTLGLNPNIRGSRISSGFDDLLDHYRSLRVYLHTTANEYEDGYNLSLLEAMAVGMPIISTENKTSPIINGINGYISDDIQYLRTCVARLLDDPVLANFLGQKARETVREKFSQIKFLQLWIKSIEVAIVEFLERSTKELPKKDIGLNTQPENTSIPQYFQNIRDDIVSLVPDDAVDILEIGCAAGMTGNELKKRPGIYVAGVELDHRAAVEAKKVLDEVVEGNIETLKLPFKEKRFDCILFADVLEHLIDPLAVLKKTRKLLRANGTVIASIPNV